MASGRRVEGDIRSLQLQCATVLHESLLLPVLMYGSETMIWKEREKSRIRAVQIRELCGVMKGVDKRIYEGVLRWFGHMERIENERIPISM